MSRPSSRACSPGSSRPACSAAWPDRPSAGASVFVGAAVLTAAARARRPRTPCPAEHRPPHRARCSRASPPCPRVVRRSPDLWRACVRQAGMYGAWSALWTSLALLLTERRNPAYGLTTATAGLFGLFGLAASVVAPLAGGFVDRFGAAKVVRSAYLLAAAVRTAVLAGRAHAVVSLFVAAIAVHAALVASHVANQTLALTTTSTPGHRQHGLRGRRFRGRRHRLGPRGRRRSPTWGGAGCARWRGCGWRWGGSPRRYGGDVGVAATAVRR